LLAFFGNIKCKDREKRQRKEERPLRWKKKEKRRTVVKQGGLFQRSGLSSFSAAVYPALMAAESLLKQPCIFCR
jgi:hypothetical protein